MCCQVCRGSLRWQVFKRSNPGQIEDGIVWCIACGYWYPIEDSLLEFLAADLAYTADRDRFWEKYRTQLEAIGLHPVGNSGQTSGPQRTQQEHFDWYANNNEQSLQLMSRCLSGMPWTTASSRNGASVFCPGNGCWMSAVLRAVPRFVLRTCPYTSWGLMCQRLWSARRSTGTAASPDARTPA